MVSDENEKYRTMFLDFFLNPSNYPEKTGSVQKIETHASYVFLTDRYAYKIKKNVNLGFLDFSSLEKRKHFTYQEFLLNQRLCRDIYIGVIPIWKKNSSFSFENGNEIIEYALKMHRMSDEDFFLERLKNNKIHDSDLDEIAKLISEFYKHEKSTPEISQWGECEKIKITTDENFEQTKKYIDFALSAQSYNLIRYYTEQFFEINNKLFSKRINDGWIRNCHGDMHLDHFHKHNNTWCIFDCIEFNDRFRCTDVACDIAFVLMDLDYNRKSGMSQYLRKKIDEYLLDSDRKKLLDFYKCYRAYVRGKVESMIASGVPDDKASLQLAKKYFQLSLQYALVGSGPFALIFMGRIASGKSKLAKRFCEEADISIYSCDEKRKTLAGIPLLERTPEHRKKEIYSEDFSEKTYGAVMDSAFEMMTMGSPAILDCTFSKEKYRKKLIQRLSEKKIPYVFVEAVVSDEIMKERLKKRAEKKDVISDARLEDFEKINSKFENPEELNPENLILMDTSSDKDTTFYQCGIRLIDLLLKKV